CIGIPVPAGTFLRAPYAPFIGSPQSTACCAPLIAGLSTHFSSLADQAVPFAGAFLAGPLAAWALSTLLVPITMPTRRQKRHSFRIAPPAQAIRLPPVRPRGACPAPGQPDPRSPCRPLGCP